ncbi:MAG: hypothetical protein H7061_12880 [Bdellovibrionaceae bacterium]|nr:hypothetical protein [Bdellovibrio sp.]
MIIFTVVLAAIYLMAQCHKKKLSDKEVEPPESSTAVIESKFRNDPIKSSFTTHAKNKIEMKTDTQQANSLLQTSESKNSVSQNEKQALANDFPEIPTGIKGLSTYILILEHRFYAQDVLVSTAIKNIGSAFRNGTYPEKKTLEAFAGTYSGWIEYSATENTLLILKWNLVLDNGTDPVKAQFSLKWNGIERSCNAGDRSVLKNITTLSEDNAAILVMSCDKSFYMQLYKTKNSMIYGNLYEKKNDQYIRTAFVHLGG